MKKFFLTLALFATALVCSAQQKSYVTVSAHMSWYSSAILSGAIPASMKKSYTYADFMTESGSPSEWIGNVFNLLAAEGFVLEHVNSETYSTSNTAYNNAETIFIFSKIAQNPSSDTGVNDPVVVAPETKAVEVGRYNLQGLPVKASDKGLQIIVYSNYTTKTVVVE